MTTTIGMVAIIDAMLFGTLCALAAVGMGAGLEVAVLLAVGGFAVGFVLFAVLGMRAAMGQQARALSDFPTPGDPPR